MSARCRRWASSFRIFNGDGSCRSKRRATRRFSAYSGFAPRATSCSWGACSPLCSVSPAFAPFAAAWMVSGSVCARRVAAKLGRAPNRGFPRATPANELARVMGGLVLVDFAVGSAPAVTPALSSSLLLEFALPFASPPASSVDLSGSEPLAGVLATELAGGASAFLLRSGSCAAGLFCSSPSCASVVVRALSGSSDAVVGIEVPLAFALPWGSSLAVVVGVAFSLTSTLCFGSPLDASALGDFFCSTKLSGFLSLLLDKNARNSAKEMDPLAFVSSAATTAPRISSSGTASKPASCRSDVTNSSEVMLPSPSASKCAKLACTSTPPA